MVASLLERVPAFGAWCVSGRAAGPGALRAASLTVRNAGASRPSAPPAPWPSATVY